MASERRSLHRVPPMASAGKDSELQEVERQIRDVERRIAAHPAVARAIALARKASVPFRPPPHSVAIPADVTDFDFAALGEAVHRSCGRLFDVLVIDPPWKVASANPTRGVAIKFPTMPDAAIARLPVRCVQDQGLLFLWVVNGRHAFGIQTLLGWGYRYVTSVAWVKQTSKGNLAKGHGFYLQHAKETCLVGMKGTALGVRVPRRTVIEAVRREQSRKPDELYAIIEEAAPNGMYLELFGRRHNLRDNWVTIGNQL